jgi:hypothetical protein
MAEVDNTNRGIDNSRYYRKTEFNNCFIVYIHLLYIHLTLRTGSKPFCLRFQRFGTFGRFLANNAWTSPGLGNHSVHDTFFGPKKGLLHADELK